MHDTTPMGRLAVRFMTFAAVCSLLGACADEARDPDDPRLGEQGMVRFTGGGCSGSTVMAVGSHATLTMEPARGQSLPRLTVASDSQAIAAEPGEQPDQLRLDAHAEGEARVSVYDGGALYDAIRFQAEPAGAVRHQVVPRVFAGGSLDVVITDVFGRCGNEDCPLFGDGFLAWTSDPPVLSLRLDDRGAATFTAGDPLEARVRGREPVTGKVLVDAIVDVVPVANVSGMRATLRTIPLEEGEEARVLPLPGAAVAPDTAFCISLEAVRDGQPSVPISRRDVGWSVDAEPGSELVLPVPMDHGTEPLGTVFLAGSEPGLVRLNVAVPLLEREESFELRVE